MRGRPNIVLVFPDQLSARWLGCYGHPVVRTPRLDGFAREGLRFARAHASCPLCSPYRAGLMTGLYPSQHGVTENGLALPDGLPTLAGSLEAAGYATHYFGKWHLSGPPGGNHMVPPERRGGFRHFVGWESHHIEHWQGLAWADDADEPIRLRGHETDGLTDLVCDALECMEREPFCLVVSYQSPHPPCSPPAEHRARYAGAPVGAEPNADPDARFQMPPWGEDCGIRDFRERYFGEITHLDAAFGRALDALERTGLAESTAVVFTSDHGEMAGAHGLFGKGVMYDEAARVPLIVRMPGTPARGTVQAPVSSLDLTPTLLSLAGAEPLPGAGGIDLTGVLTGTEAPDDRRAVIIEHRQLCVVQGRHKLIADSGCTRALALYDVESDPYELENRVSDRSRRPAVGELMDALSGWRKRLSRTTVA